jgi:hypothetical protein
MVFTMGVLNGLRFEAHHKWMEGLFLAVFIAAWLLAWDIYKHGSERTART